MSPIINSFSSDQFVRQLNLTKRAGDWYKRHAGHAVCRNFIDVRARTPIISFTFDDFPRSAFLTGGAILQQYGLRGTYYVSLGLLEGDSPSGKICSAEEVKRAFDEGHELGCHTFSHCHSWDTDWQDYEKSIAENARAFQDLIPGASFKSFSYPIALPHPANKRASAGHFASCRAGGQKINHGRTDVNQLSAFFLEKTGGDLSPVAEIIAANAAMRGWLVFATHDVDEHHGPYGCSPDFFEKVVRLSVESGARVLPITRALEELRSGI